ncbi:MAG: hypothetical protein NTY09_01910 [bacterium]|nr:hypothetical protein [bacterium]
MIDHWGCPEMGGPFFFTCPVTFRPIPIEIDFFGSAGASPSQLMQLAFNTAMQAWEGEAPAEPILNLNQ